MSDTIGRHLASFNLFRESDGSLAVTIAEARGVAAELNGSGAPLALCAMAALRAALNGKHHATVPTVPTAPAVIPFGNDMVMTATARSEDKAFIVVRAVGDEFVGGEKPVDEAWAANEKNGGPAWFLSFDSAESARNIAELCEELADSFEPTTPARNTSQIGEG